MNIFFLHYDPVICAEWMVDKHVGKMILESAQLLSTAHRFTDGIETKIRVNGRNRKIYRLDDGRDAWLYAATHINHPCTVWCRTSIDNYLWLSDLLYALGDEYTFRYGKTHKTISSGIAYYLQSPPFSMRKKDWTEPPSCMAEEFKLGNDPILNYRNYYIRGNTNLHSWKKRQPPEWI